MSRISRRNFLKISTMATAGVCFGLPNGTQSFIEHQEAVHSKYAMGRILYEGTQSFQEPCERSKIINSYAVNDVVDLLDPIVIASERLQTETWYQLPDGSFLKSTNFQPVHNKLNTPLIEIPKNGLLAEISVPFTTAFHDKKNIRKPDEVFYYGSLHWIYRLGIGSDDRYYYLVREDRWGDGYYVDATHMHVFAEEELAPISPDVKPQDKRIEVSLRDQIVMAYTGDDLVFLSAMASGMRTDEKDLSTPPGRYKITYKRPSRHMAHSDLVGSTNSPLFGVPWVAYFTSSGIAFHGTYWHNEFNHPRSHGCINLPIPAARWIYLWALPVVPAKEKTYVSNYGTSVEVI